MFSVLESFSSAVQSIRAHALRSFLTALGIIIGVASVIAIISIGQGLSVSISSQFKGLGSNGLTLVAYTPFEDALQGKQNVLGLSDYEKIVAHVEDISNVSPTFAPFGNFGTNVRYAGRSTFTQVTAVTSAYAEANQVFPRQGRFISASDNQSRRKVCIIGSKLRENLELPENPLGKFLEIGGEWFKIVGVTEEKGESFGLSMDDYVLIPFSVGEVVAGNDTKLNLSITLTVNHIEELEAVQGRLTALLRQAHHIKPGQGNDFRVQTAQQLTDTFESIVGTLTMVLGGIVSIS